MKALHIRVKGPHADALTRIKREYKKKFGMNLSLNEIGNRAVALGYYAAAKQLNVAP